jgi:hypothetical protein
LRLKTRHLHAFWTHKQADPPPGISTGPTTLSVPNLSSGLNVPSVVFRIYGSGVLSKWIAGDKPTFHS